MLWSRRTIFLALVVGAPVVLGVIIRILTSAGDRRRRCGWAARPIVSGPSIFGLFIWLLYLRFIVPVLGVFYGTSLIADEVEDKTITYLFTRPISRGAIVIGKYLAYLAATVLVVLPSVMVLYFLVVPTGGGSLAAALPGPAEGPGAARDRPGGLRRAVRLGRGPVQVPAGHRPGVRVRVGAGDHAGPGLPEAAHHRLLHPGAGAARDAPGQRPEHPPGGRPGTRCRPRCRCSGWGSSG